MKFVFGALGLLLVLALSSGAPAEVTLEQALGRTVARIDVQNQSAVPEWEIRSLFLLRPGDRYDPRVLQRSLALLAQKQGIRTVRVTGSEEGEGLALRIEVVPEPLIYSIRFTGNRQFNDKELAARVRSAVDQAVYGPFLESDAQTIRDLYAEEGFLAVGVVPQVEPRSDPLWVDLVYRITEGEPSKVVRVETGALGDMESERALLIVGLGQGSRASVRKLKEGVRKLLRVLHREGYPEARATKPRFEREPEGMAMVLSVVAGEPIDIRIEGTDGVADGSLMERAEEHYGQPIDADWADRVAAAMAESLRTKGHRNAIIAPEIGEKFDHKRVTFHVDEGPRVRVKKVLFDGNASEPANKLRGYMSLVQGGILRAPPFTQESLDRDVRALNDLYVSRGYLDAKVSVTALDVAESGEATLKLRVAEGQRYVFGRLEFRCEGALTPEEAAAISELRSGEPANPADLETARVKLLAEIAKKGYAGASVTYVSEKRREDQLVDVAFRVAAEGLARFGKFVVSGNARTNSRVILRELTFKEGEPWNAKEVLVSRQALIRLGFFQRVLIEPLDPEGEGEVRDVRVAVEEQDAGSVSLSFGYGTEEGPNASVELGHANLQGHGREARIRAGLEGKDWSASASFREPWFLGYRLDLVASLLRQFQSRPGYDVATSGFQLSLDKKVTEWIRASLLYTLENNELSEVATDADVKNIGQYLLSAIGPVLAWDSRDDPFNPTRGYQHTIQAEWALEALGSEVQYARYLGSTAGYFSWGRLTLALLARGGYAENFGKTAELPANKRFYLGGRTSVRGFARDEIGPKDAGDNPLGGDTMLNFRAELRFPIWRQLGGDLFWDAGNVWNRQVESPDYLHLRQGAGGGIRYGTPVGPLSLDIGFKLDRQEGEPPTEWYFTVGNVF